MSEIKHCPACGSQDVSAACRCPISDRLCGGCGAWWHVEGGKSVLGTGHDTTRRSHA